MRAEFESASPLIRFLVQRNLRNSDLVVTGNRDLVECLVQIFSLSHYQEDVSSMSPWHASISKTGVNITSVLHV